jgi:hypothetical protein
MTCPNCGTDLLQGTRWCTACGHDLMPQLGEPSSRSQLLQAITDRAKPLTEKATSRTPSIGLLGVLAVITVSLTFRLDSLVFNLWSRGQGVGLNRGAGLTAQIVVAALALACAALAWRALAALEGAQRVLGQVVIGVAVFAASMATLSALYWATLDQQPFG